MSSWTGRGAAGWYPDPFREGAFRWYDGARWTTDLAAGAWGPAPAPHPQRARGFWIAPINRSWQAVLAPYLALLAIFPALLPLGALIAVPMAVGAIMLGVWAIRLPVDDLHRGRIRAGFAIVLATGVLVGAVAVTAAAAPT